MMSLSTHIGTETARVKRVGDWCAFGREYQATINPPVEALV